LNELLAADAAIGGKMPKTFLKSALLGAASAMCLISLAHAEKFNIPSGDLANALEAYTAQSGVQLLVSHDLVRNVKTSGVTGSLSSSDALVRLLHGTGLAAHREDGAVAIIPGQSSELDTPQLQFAQATPARSAVETVTVTSSKLGGADVQSIPISITALSQEQLTATQTNGGPDLIKQVPNMSFTKTNFSGYSIQLRGIGTQAISVTTDPAVAVAFNDIPFLRNHFFEQEFFDLAQAEVLRGPQGTLYGRNATAGVVNLTSAKPTDQFEAMASGEIGNYHQRRFEGMINLPIVDDRFDIRVAGEWTKRQGYSFNELTNERIDGRDLWSGRATIGFKPTSNLQTYLVWEHFSEDDDRLRSGKQLCKTDPGVDFSDSGNPGNLYGGRNFLSQGCLPTSLYSADAFQVPNGLSLPYYQALTAVGFAQDGVDPYLSTRQSRNLRVIESAINPGYKAKNDIVELNTDYKLSPDLTFVSQTGFNHDFLYSTEDFNRFNTSPGIFHYEDPADPSSYGGLQSNSRGQVSPDGVFCDPQLGCSDRLVAQDLVKAKSWQVSQEFRLTSNLSGPFNFSVGGNYLHYETEENYYVFFNTTTLFASFPLFSAGPSLRNAPWIPGVSDNHECLPFVGGYHTPGFDNGGLAASCSYIDPNSLSNLNDQGHNYFLSQNPYGVNSYAAFGEVYYNITEDLKFTTGLRFTEDQKHFSIIPSQLLNAGYGYGVKGAVDQVWDQFSGRFAANWTPKLKFTDQTLIYGTYAHGYKAGGANPPGAINLNAGDFAGNTGADFQPIHPLTFKPEFVDAFELGSKNTLLDGALTLNADVFYYNYENYQISQIVDRTSVNLNFDAHIKGAELESSWEPLPGLRFNFAGGWEQTNLAKGSQAVDLMDRTAGHSGWVVAKPGITESSNCILPTNVAALVGGGTIGGSANVISRCDEAYVLHNDPVTGAPYTTERPLVFGTGFCCTDLTNYEGFDPSTAPNNGEGFSKDLGGNELPNAPPLTVSAGAQYTIPLSSDWAGTLRGDYYWQDYSWARIFNDNPYDRLRGYTNVNLTLIFTNQNGWQVMLYDKNVFNTTAITGDFLNSDDSGLTTNVFLTDPKLIGIRVTKNW
jgi:outer membrane receptor protein involved in Fe transport